VQIRPIGKEGVVVLPPTLRKQFGLQEGSLVVAEARDDGILLRPIDASLLETYTSEREAEFFLNNAVDAADFAQAVAQVRRMGLDPAQIPHDKPAGA
jgi:AbrB family looped-hinge helix DNA binding protein